MHFIHVIRIKIHINTTYTKKISASWERSQKASRVALLYRNADTLCNTQTSSLVP